MTRVGSLCSGYGGLDLGLELALGPVEHAWHVEYDKHPSAILAHRFPDVPNHGDLTTLDYDALPRVDWLTAGYPCQPFSHAGKRKGKADARHLWPFVADAIGRLRPGNVLLENVRGHLSLGLADVLADLSGLGYDARWGVVRAADAGAPHGRARIFVVAGNTASARDGGEPRVLRGASGAPGGTRTHEGRLRDAAQRSGLAADARGGSLARPAAAGDGLRLAAERGDLAPADADSAGRRGLAQLDSGAPTGLHGEHRGHPDRRDDVPDWGAYTGAIRRWEAVLGRPAPRPTEPGRSGERLSPRFVEWMMGLPAGWVTDVPGLPRNAQLKALGNGVVPQQAALALHLLGATTAGEVAA